MNFIQKVIDIRSTTDPENAIKTLSDSVSIRGYNMWLLFCSAALASIGLDTNSTAVIIGAMLISPLMSPILGIGLSFGIHDKTLMVRSLRNFAIAVVLSLIASVLYFLISPFGNPTAEIQARTYPTLLDVLVALFGGVAGIVSASRSGDSIAIPGVAIATALMPPLCTAGYGIAKMEWSYFAGAFYLFFINAVVISLSTYLVVKYLQFPQKEFASRAQKKYYTLIITLLVSLAVIPSFYFLISVYNKEIRKKTLNTVVLDHFKNQGNEILKWELEEKDTTTWIKVYYSGASINDSTRKVIDQNLQANNMKEYKLKPLRVNMTREEVNALSADVAMQMFQQLQLEQLAKEKELPQPDTLSYVQLNKETKIAFPFIDTLYNGWLTLPDTLQKIDTIPMIYYRSANINNQQEEQLYQYLKTRFVKDTVIINKMNGL